MAKIDFGKAKSNTTVIQEETSKGIGERWKSTSAWLPVVFKKAIKTYANNSDITVKDFFRIYFEKVISGEIEYSPIPEKNYGEETKVAIWLPETLLIKMKNYCTDNEIRIKDLANFVVVTYVIKPIKK